MRRVPALLLAAYLLGWVPFTFANALFAAVPSLGMRGGYGLLELALHGLVTLLSAAAGWMVIAGSPAAWSAATAAVLARGAASLQAIFFSALPRDVPPGSRLPLALLTVGLTLFWLAVIRLSRARDVSQDGR